MIGIGGPSKRKKKITQQTNEKSQDRNGRLLLFLVVFFCFCVCVCVCFVRSPILTPHDAAAFSDADPVLPARSVKVTEQDSCTFVSAVSTVCWPV